jgi:hypothetical protein
MLDKREYPSYAAWDLAFNKMALSLVDIDFAKETVPADVACMPIPMDRGRPLNGTMKTELRPSNN